MIDRRKDRSTDVGDLLRQRAILRHLVYFMEHDRSLNAEVHKIDCLRTMLQAVEQRIGMR